MTPSGAGRIATNLRAAAMAGLQAGQPRAPAGAAGTAAQIVAQVDATLMRRRLTFTFDTGKVLHVEAAGRRLVRLMEPAPSGLPPELAASFGRALTPDDAAGVVEILGSLCAGAASVSARADPIEDEADPTETGLATAPLAEALGTPPETGIDTPRVASFLERVADELPCAMHVAGDTAEALWGAPEDLAELAERGAPVLDVLLDPATETARAMDLGGLLCLDAASGMALVVCLDRAGFVLALAPAEAMARLAEAWASA